LSVEDIILNATHPSIPTRITLLHAEVQQVRTISKRQLQRYVAKLVVTQKLEYVRQGSVEGYCRKVKTW
jgi:hypothetical protein